MPRQLNEDQKQVVGRVMTKYKHGAIEKVGGGRVKSRKQAIAVALSKADASGSAAGKARRSNATGPTKSELYEEARRRDIPGRSRMRKSELMRVLGH
ncbi:DUF6496 domain-containing protein [Niveispirillum fermenti]|uniref:DUF6496 domain-containing protein n=1 Tax=Niveispirillum fermenti TaxID=1233113 RepID=UPI003A891D63